MTRARLPVRIQPAPGARQRRWPVLISAPMAPWFAFLFFSFPCLLAEGTD